MDWLRAVDGYCERTGAGYWAEPVNALTNAAFLVAAVLAWRLARRAGDRAAQVLCVILGAIGIGSYLFHTHAQVWAMMADVVPIQVFILVYLALATVRFFALPWWAGGLAALAFVPLAAGLSRAVAAAVGPLNGSVSYVPVPVLIVGYAAPPRAAGPGDGAGAGERVPGSSRVSLLFRTIDAGVCGGFALGTHFLWHLLNAAMLGWMIRVFVRAGLRQP